MDTKTFEIALAKKISKELDNPDNWCIGVLDSLKHKTKDYIISTTIYDEDIAIISPKMYHFENKNLTKELYKKCKLVIEHLKFKKEDEIRNKLIEEFGLEDRATKLRALEEISKTMPDPPTLPEEIKLPPKKKKFWKNWF